jgi:hypothetical protein
MSTGTTIPTPYRIAPGNAVEAAIAAVKAAGHTTTKFDLSDWPTALDDGAKIALAEIYKHDLSLAQGVGACRAVSRAFDDTPTPLTHTLQRG